MARKITEIQTQIIASKNSYDQLAGLTSSSNVAEWRLWTYIVSVAIWLLENLFDVHTNQTLNTIAEMKPHGLRWYYNKAIAFQYGRELVAEEDYYDNSALTEEEIEAEKVVKQAAVTEESDYTQIKVAGQDGDGNLEQLGSTELAAFTAYMNEIKDAGVYLEIVSRVPTRLLIELTVYYNPVILDENGLPLSGGDDEPVRIAANEYLRELSFDGELVLAHLTDKLQSVNGVRIPVITSAQADNSSGVLIPINVRVTPFAGYFSFADGEDDLLTITYIADV